MQCKQTFKQSQVGLIDEPTHFMKKPNNMARKQAGQALIFILVFAAATGLIVLMLFNSAQLANTKSQLQNTADAAAYSAAILQARDNNFSAYTNRAMVANQVAVAQMVSLESYMEDAAQTHKRANSFLHDNIYAFTAAFTPLWDVAKKVPVDKEYNAIKNFVPGAVKGLDGIIKLLEGAQQLHHVGTLGEMVFVTQEVVKKNDPQAELGVSSAFAVADGAFRLTNWSNSITSHRANDNSAEADRFADVVVDKRSMDSFTPSRGSAPLALWASPVKPILCPGGFGFSVYAFGHLGGTQLSSNKANWFALDATTGGGFAFCILPVPFCIGCWFFPFGDFSTTSPFFGGHGGAQAGKQAKYDSFGGYKNNSSKNYGGAVFTPPGFYRYQVKGPDSTLDSGGGLQDNYRDMTNPNGKKPVNQSAEENGGSYPIVIEVERKRTTVRQSTDLLKDSQLVRLDESLKGDTMKSVASAHAFFYRPVANNLSLFTKNGWARADGRTELENLFSPYWQARLSDTSVVERASSAALQ